MANGLYNSDDIVLYEQIGGYSVLLYLTSDDNKDIFDFLIDRRIIIKKLVGEISFKRFVIHDMKNLDHYSHIVVDLEALNDSQDEIIEAIIAFKMIYNSKIIIFAKEVNNIFLSKIAKEADIYDIIIAKDPQDINDKMAMCLNQEDKFRDEVRRYVNRLNLKYSFPKNNVKILVAGVKSIFGATKTAINLATSLAEIGASVSYTEVNGSGYLKKIANYYEFKDSYYRDIMFFDNGDVPLDFNFNIIDIGILKEKSLKIFNSKELGDVKILCGSTKESEEEDLIKYLDDENSKVDVILNFTSDKERNTAKKLLKGRKSLYFSDDSVALFDTKNSQMFREILSEYIIENKKV